MCDALSRHQQWCAAGGLAGAAYEERRAKLASEAATELNRWAPSMAGMPAMPPR